MYGMSDPIDVGDTHQMAPNRRFAVEDQPWASTLAPHASDHVLLGETI
jgi:hypothetical protein